MTTNLSSQWRSRAQMCESCGQWPGACPHSNVIPRPPQLIQSATERGRTRCVARLHIIHETHFTILRQCDSRAHEDRSALVLLARRACERVRESHVRIDTRSKCVAVCVRSLAKCTRSAPEALGNKFSIVKLNGNYALIASATFTDGHTHRHTQTQTDTYKQTQKCIFPTVHFIRINTHVQTHTHGLALYAYVVSMYKCNCNESLWFDHQKIIILR